MTSCWHEDPDERPEFTKIREDLMQTIESELYSTALTPVHTVLTGSDTIL
jgi:hypothetical protein